MNKYLYEKIAITNIQKNKKLYLPYLFAIIGGMMFCYIMYSIGVNPDIYDAATGREAFKGASTLCGILGTGSFVTAIFAFIFLLYANSFVLKHQKKQFGLYRVLGMERRHIIRIIITEILFTFSIGLVLALFLGVLFDKLMLVFLFKIIGQIAPMGFNINTGSFIYVLKLTGGIILLIFVRSVVSVFASKDIELLKSEKMGETEPKNRPLLTLIGIIFLAIGYYIALNSANAGEAINNFFPAALLVMSATYDLFSAGSIAVLKLLKNNKKFYYKTNHFISVSGMLYRMKQNANGLATICILSTAAIIVLSAGSCLYANGERSINEQFPRTIQLRTEASSRDTVNEILTTALADKSITAQEMVTCTYVSSLFMKTSNGIAPMSDGNFTGFTNIPDTFIMTLDEYNRFNQTSDTLLDNEILLYASDNFYTADTLSYMDETFLVKGTADNSCLTYITDSSMTLFSKLLIVVSDEAALQKFITNEKLSSRITWMGFNVKNNVDSTAFAQDLSNALNASGLKFDLTEKNQEREAFYSMYGGILFIGIVLGVLFILSTAMIIYYKQMSEGHEDRERFLIMQKVGLSKQEIKSSIHSQIMLVFFLPLIAAIIHSGVALKIVASCLKMVIVVHMPTFITSVAVTCVLFSIVYMIVYKITSKEYYNIVNE